MPKRLLYICQYFSPEEFRGNDIAFDMARRGVEVTAICGTPNYPKGRFFEGYGLFKRNIETVNGVRVIRLPIVPRGKGGSIRLLANYFSYFIVASLFLPFHLLFNKKYDACFVQQLSPVMMSVPGIIFKKLTKRPLYTWVLDLWPESLKAAGGIGNKHILSFFGLFAKSEYRNSDVILVSSKGFAKNIESKGDFAGKIRFMPNWAEDELQSDVILDTPDLPDGFKVLFAGNVGEAQDFDSIVEAASLLKPDDNIHFIIVGDGRKKEWVEEQIAGRNLNDRLVMLGRYHMKYMPSFFRKADCLLLSLKDDEIMNLTVPAKIQAYMANGKPVIAMINGDANELVKDVGCGLSVAASSPNELVKAVRIMKSMSNEDLQKMGERGKRYCDTHFSKKSILDSLYNLIFQNS